MGAAPPARRHRRRRAPTRTRRRRPEPGQPAAVSGRRWRGTNRIGASRLYELGRILGVGVQFFFEDAPSVAGQPLVTPGFADDAAEGFVVDFLSSREGIDLNRAFVRIPDPKVRRAVIDLMRTLGGDDADA